MLTNARRPSRVGTIHQPNPATNSYRSKFECSCGYQRYVTFFQSPRRIGQTLIDVFRLKIRIGLKYLVTRPSGGKEPKYRTHGYTQSPNARLSTHNGGIEGDMVQTAPLLLFLYRGASTVARGMRRTAQATWAGRGCHPSGAVGLLMLTPHAVKTVVFPMQMRMQGFLMLDVTNATPCG